MELLKRLRALAIFRNLLEDPVIASLCDLLEKLEEREKPNLEEIASAYGAFVSRLYMAGDGNLSRYILNAAESDENAYVRIIGRNETPPEYMTRCLEQELETLEAAASLASGKLRASLQLLPFLPDFGHEPVQLADSFHRRLKALGQYGYGIYARHHMFYLDEGGRIVPVRHPDGVQLSELMDYQREKQLILHNTRALLEGRPAANVLLTGDAGTGKSSTIKAVVNALYPEGLRVIEVRKEQLRELPAVLDELSENPLKFILFIDDLSFQKGDDNYSALKAVLEGSVSARSRNVAIYATSNRRHLVKETFSDREGDDIHRNDTMQEAVSLSERFGLQITFQKPDKAAYLNIVRHLAEERGAVCPELDMLAERFALGRGGRSPRAARQFVDSLPAEKALKR